MRPGDIVVIIYQDRLGEFTKRRIRIISASDQYIRAYCFSRRQIRLFNKNGILSQQRIKSA
jgi:predicted DNA-binding transcriptional regulator YafY